MRRLVWCSFEKTNLTDHKHGAAHSQEEDDVAQDLELVVAIADDGELFGLGQLHAESFAFRLHVL